MLTTIGRELAALESAAGDTHGRHVYDHDPMVKVGGVSYALVYGDGHGPWDGVYGAYPPAYVWVSVHDPEYTAPPHVQTACYAAYDLAMEVRAAEYAAGWDPNP